MPLRLTLRGPLSLSSKDGLVLEEAAERRDPVVPSLLEWSGLGPFGSGRDERCCDASDGGQNAESLSHDFLPKGLSEGGRYDHSCEYDGHHGGSPCAFLMCVRFEHYHSSQGEARTVFAKEKSHAWWLLGPSELSIEREVPHPFLCMDEPNTP